MFPAVHWSKWKRFDELNLKLFTFDFIRRLPKLTRHLEYVIWHRHRKRCTLFSISPAYSFAPDIDWCVQYVNERGMA